ncbi:acyltransferase (plasmid) [Haladaptatus sp. SPP-AMP-3]|uniref:acyltransferase n=1 Tax=Haladaptatus sp. SPP-AMP-3 TaxID=3121295 RepID=UPI003C2CEA40
MTLSKLTHALQSDVFREKAAILGVRGVLRSMYYSRKLAGSVDRLLLHPNVVVPQTEGDAHIDGYLAMGVNTPGISHPEMVRGKLSVPAEGEVSVTCDGRLANIGCGSVLHVEGDFSMGESSITANAKILCEDTISIGDYCALSWDISLLDTDRHQHYHNTEPQSTTAPIRIRDNVWIGHSTTVTKGVTIGEGAIVASNSVVTEDVPPGVLVGGSPAEIIRENVTWDSAWNTQED